MRIACFILHCIKKCMNPPLPDRIRISVMPVMQKRQLGTWFNQPVVSNTHNSTSIAIPQASVEDEDRNGMLDWTVSSMRCNIEKCTTSLATIYKEEYNGGAFEASPTLSIMTALSYASGRTVPIPPDFEEEDFLRAMTVFADLPHCQSEDPSIRTFALQECTNSELQSKRKKEEESLIPSRPIKRHSPQDLYSPTVVRGGGYLKEGLCPLCSTPTWFKIKQSAYWYHMNFTHGISAMTGLPYEMPSNINSFPFA